MKLDRRPFLKFDFKKISKFLKLFKLKSFNNKNKVKQYVKFFNLELLIKKQHKLDNLQSKNNNVFKNVLKSEKKPFNYELDDLCRLHWIVLNKKILNTLEFGSGYSTIFLADACFILNKFFGTIKNLRVDKKFHVYSLEESKRYLNVTKKRIPKILKKHISIEHSLVEGIKYFNKYATVYKKIPSISPDFIYLDGPSQYAVKKRVDGFSFEGVARFPMSADLLKMEYFLEPGTFILVDGRTANSRFLKDHFRRKWKYKHDNSGDCHYFELNEKPLGIHNKNKLKFKFD